MLVIFVFHKCCIEFWSLYWRHVWPLIILNTACNSACMSLEILWSSNYLFIFPSKSSLIILLDWGHFFNKLGPKELGGAIDLVNQFKLLHHHEFFCKRALPSSLSETHYLRNVVGDTEIRKGEGMELDQLFQTSSYVRQRDYSLCPSDLEVLGEAFRMRDLTPIDLPSVRHLLHMYLSSYSFPILRCISR